MAASAGTVTLDLDANSVKLLRELQKTQKATQRTANKMRSSMTNSFNAIKVAALAAFGVHLVRSVIDAGLAMDRFARTFKVATGSAEGAASEMAFVSEMANRLGVDLLTAGGAFAKLTAAAKGTALAGANTRKIFESLAEATMVLGLNAADSGQILTAVEQMISKGKVSAEELRRQMQKLPGAFQMAARAMDISTAELDKMLSSGKLMAEDLLPKLADELHKTFGPGVEEASNSAQAQFARLGNSLFELRAGISDSGLLGLMTDLAIQARKVAIGLGALFLNASPEAFGKELLDARDRLEELTTSRDFLIDIGEDPLGAVIISLENDIIKAESKIAEFKTKSLDAMTRVAEVIDGTLADSTSVGMDQFLRQFETAEQKVSRLRDELFLFKKDMDPAEYARIFAKIGEELTKGLDEIVLDVHEVGSELKRLWEVDMVDYAQRAAENMQDAFAEFLFDPFDKGIKGMLKGFLDVIRRILAEKAAANIFSGIDKQGGFGKFLAALFGTATTAAKPGLIGGAPKASGGPVSGGTSYMVGEKGPELFTPNQSGLIIPNNKLNSSSGVTINNNIKVEAGVSWAELQVTLPGILNQNKEQTKAEIQQLMRNGQFA